MQVFFDALFRGETTMTLDNFRFRLLMIDDDALMHASIRMGIPDNWQVDGQMDFSSIPSLQPYHAALVDMHLTGNLSSAEGVSVIENLRRQHPHLEIIAMSGNLDRDIMEQCLKAGATRFLAKPISSEELVLVLSKIESLHLLRRASMGQQQNRCQWIGNSPQSHEVLRKVADTAAESGPILIEGETGTGKEVVAKLIHALDSRRPHIAINVAAINGNLFESEFFGHVKGSFTGADQNKMGLVEAAHGGDLFLDEIEALPLEMQAKLLRILESGEVRRVGSREVTTVHVRIIAATNVCLKQMVADGNFREDLLWRLKGCHIQIPPLRQRKGDISVLARYFLEHSKPNRQKVFAQDAVKALEDYDWPGNVRELKRVCEQLAITAPLPIIREQDVMQALFKSPLPSHLSVDSKFDLKDGLAALIGRVEARVIQQALETENDVEDASKVLQISRSSLYKKIKEYQLTMRS
jgi:DNA-binding NtrC family response regulator